MKPEPKILKLLNKRGIKTDDEIQEFLSPKPKRTYDPFLLHNMEAGMDLILSHIEAGSKICIYGDYDADGVTSTVIMIDVLSNLTDNLVYYIPSRFHEGYGLNSDAIKKINDFGVDLIITVDCGSVSWDEVELAKNLGMEILVTDHHNVTDKIADCIVINPNQPDCEYPCNYLAGCGVAFKVCQAIAMNTGLPKSVLTGVLDMVALGTIGDIVPLLDENRTLVKYGMRVINTGSRKSLRKLIESVGLKIGEVTSENISFIISPHINAAGRISRATLAVEMFLANNDEEIEGKIQEIKDCNSKRKTIQEDIFKEGISLKEDKYKNDLFLLLNLGNAHEGVTGIVAGKIKEKYYRPTAILTETKENCLKGTARGIPGINLYEILKKNEELFLRFGGHYSACGFTLPKDNLPMLKERLEIGMKKTIMDNPELLVPELNVDLELDGGDINLNLMNQLELLEPYGNKNEKPLVRVLGAVNNLERIGSNRQFIRFSLVLNNGIRLSCVAFQNTEKTWEILKNALGQICIFGNLAKNKWKNQVKIQMLVKKVEEIK